MSAALQPSRPRVLLVQMPFGDLGAPSIGLGLLAALGRRAGYCVDTVPLNLVYGLRYDSHNVYSRVEQLSRVGLGEWLFAEAAFGAFQPDRPRQPDYISYLREAGQSEDLILAVQEQRTLVPAFLDHCLELVDWRGYDLVGFTTTCVELNSGLALARRLEQLAPHLRFALGGAKCEGQMGAEIFRSFEILDYVVSGEADISFPALLDDLTRGTLQGVPGVWRRDLADPAPPGPAPAAPLDSLPPPDYSDHFRWYERLGAARTIRPRMPIEGSRGCWWGERSLCTFCGLNGAMVSFRRKDPEVLLREVVELVDRHRIFSLNFTDNIIDLGYLKTFFPRLRDLGLSLDLFAEVKSNLKRAQIELLRDAGVRTLQAGVEALDTHILELMRKGVSGVRNVQFLKLATEAGLKVSWNLLFGFPGERLDDYENTLATLEAIAHLPPPEYSGPIGLDRFSPYYDQACGADGEAHRERLHVKVDSALAAADGGGTSARIRLVGPEESYRHTLPLGEEALRRVAYSFDYVFEGRDFDAAEPLARIDAFVQRWKTAWRPGSLVYYVGPSCLRIEDRRFNNAPRTITFGGDEKAIYLGCEEVTTAEQLVTRLRAQRPGFAFTVEAVRGFLDRLVERRLVLREGQAYLALALRWDGVQANYLATAEASLHPERAASGV